MSQIPGCREDFVESLLRERLFNFIYIHHWTDKKAITQRDDL